MLLFVFQVQQFLDHAAKTHDQKVMHGEKGPNLFPKYVSEMKDPIRH